MKYLKIFETFIEEFQLDEISEDKYESLADIGEIDRSKLDTIELNLPMGCLCETGTYDNWIEIVKIVDSQDDEDIIFHYHIKKCANEYDEPYYKLLYQIEKTDSFSEFYYVFEESDFDKICENPQILIDYLEKKSTT